MICAATRRHPAAAGVTIPQGPAVQCDLLVDHVRVTEADDLPALSAAIHPLPNIVRTKYSTTAYSITKAHAAHATAARSMTKVSSVACTASRAEAGKDGASPTVFRAACTRG